MLLHLGPFITYITHATSDKKVKVLKLVYYRRVPKVAAPLLWELAGLRGCYFRVAVIFG